MAKQDSKEKIEAMHVLHSSSNVSDILMAAFTMADSIGKDEDMHCSVDENGELSLTSHQIAKNLAFSRQDSSTNLALLGRVINNLIVIKRLAWACLIVLLIILIKVF
ncbi:MAG: hypothetical protein KBD83_09700 [Gammaproteobacteria bacterium]|nr:hypothetical protein [Gammaproteobacteria bacterium]